MSDSRTRLEALHHEYRSCDLCRLHRTRTAVVPGTWGAPGGLVLLTDRVSSYDEAAGRLFAGPIGELMDRILAAPKVEITKDDISVVGTVLCRGPYGRQPRPHEVAACRERLVGELTILRPRLIVALGSRALQAVTDSRSDNGPGPYECSIASVEAGVFSTTHPRDALWGDAGEMRRRKRRMYDDWQAISARYRGGNA